VDLLRVGLLVGDLLNRLADLLVVTVSESAPLRTVCAALTT